MSDELITRSQFLRNGFKSLFGLAVEVLDNQLESRARKMVIPLHRPPGALDELSFLSRCTRCDLCFEACPHDAIVRADAKYGAAVDTPVIRPEDTPCYLCEDTPCISACPEGALLPTESIHMGTAFIAKNKCLAHNGQAEMCDYCFDRCPLRQVAIVMEDRKPRVVDDVCTGCGICEYFCPAPGKAIHVVPNEERGS